MDIEDIFASLESKVQFLLLRYTQINEENHELRTKVKELEHETHKQKETITKLMDSKQHYETIKQRVTENIEALIDHLAQEISQDTTTHQPPHNIQKSNATNQEVVHDFQSKFLSQSTIKFAPDED